MTPLVTVEDYRRAARRRLPRAVFDFVEGSAGDEVTPRRSRAAFERLAFQPRALVDRTLGLLGVPAPPTSTARRSVSRRDAPPVVASGRRDTTARLNT